MKNFVFISPNFPTNYWMFCRELKNNGLIARYFFMDLNNCFIIDIFIKSIQT